VLAGAVRLSARGCCGSCSASVRRSDPGFRDPRGLGQEEGKVARRDSRERRSARSRGPTAAVAILAIIVVALAGLGVAVVNSAGGVFLGTFTIAATIRSRSSWPLHVTGGTRGAPLRLGNRVVLHSRAAWRPVHSRISSEGLFTLSRTQITFAMAGYGFIASVLPVWMLLCPRDSSRAT